MSINNNQQFKQGYSILIALLTWAAIIIQFYLMMENRNSSVAETTIRFFSFFTILTNLLVAIFFTILIFRFKNSLPGDQKNSGDVTAITVYITCVGLVYQILLRKTWHPQGMQMVTDELLHSVIPVLVLIYWFLFENTLSVPYSLIGRWLLYPLIYLIYVLIRGYFSGFYPYPFINIPALGIEKVLLNSILMTALFAVLSVTFNAIGRRKK
jgi:hypothetical protein